MWNGVDELEKILGDGEVLLGIREAVAGAGLKGDKAQVEAAGNWGSLGRLVGAVLGERFKRPVLYVTAHIPQGYEAQDDLETFTGGVVELFPAVETYDLRLESTSEIACERLRICQKLLRGEECELLVAPLQAILYPVPSREFLAGQSAAMEAGRVYAGGPEKLCRWLTDQGYLHVDRVEAAGEYASRGGIVDVFGPDQEQPVRLEFFGDEIESIRYFDLDTQRSVLKADQISITGCRPAEHAKDAAWLLEYLTAETIIILEETAAIAEVGRITRQRYGEMHGMYTTEALFRKAAEFDAVYVNHFAEGTGEAVNLGGRSVQHYENQGRSGLGELLSAARAGKKIYFFCEKPAEKERVEEMIRADYPNAGMPANFHLPIGFVHDGFSLGEEGQTIVVGHHEVFGQRQQKRRIRRIRSTQAIESFTDLQKNDLVVHVSNGIGRFLGMKTLTKNGREDEYLAIEYADQAVVHVPASKIELVHKYVGSHKKGAKLSRLGSRTWEKQKEKVNEAVEDLAGELIEIQAERESSPGIAYPADTTWQREFEGLFPYPDTEDQLSVNQEIKRDMQKSRPMDRLLCGDVGYGKTELAIRAAFKAAEFGKQVAVLVPTTVLAEQHYRTFRERLADFPFAVESVSRFKTGREAKDILKRTAMGQVDILIGTHRLLSGDVSFKDLGLVIIDEEQRFGVEHKERLKRFRRTVDLLTLTATPIPRTLHMAFLGIRDISSLMTAPLDRRSIITEVCRYEERLIRDAILRELAREGQVYYVHNRVKSIESAAARVAGLAPEARVIFAHGQMSRMELEERMMEFVMGQADVLVCTTIIESGLDIPNANTMIIEDADRFGLAELHQLRGRVGRYKNRAYAYMLLPMRRAVNPTALKRLKAIEEYSQLGSGFKIAMRDLEIRGAGNILGAEQSGHIDAVGYELYCRMLAGAVRKLRQVTEPARSDVHLELPVSTTIPRSYIASEMQRMEVYRRLAVCSTAQDLEQLEKDLTDLFGKPSPSVRDLLQLAEIRILAGRRGIRGIQLEKPDLIFRVEKMGAVKDLLGDVPGRATAVDERTVYVRLPARYLESTQTLLAVLRKMLKQEPHIAPEFHD